MKDPLVEIGALIRSAREQSKMSIEELSSESRVSSQHILNIEAGNRADLPEETYLLGFLSKLFKTLRIENGTKMISLFKNAEADFIVQSLVDSNDSEEELPLEQSSTFKIQHLYISLGILLLVIFWFLINNANKDNESWIKKKPAQQKIIEKKKLPEPSEEFSQFDKNTDENGDIQLPEEEKKIVYANTSVRGKGNKSITVRVREIAWVQVIGMDHMTILFEGDVFPTSEPNQFIFRDNDGFVIATGNAGAFDVDAGEGFSRIGASGQLTKWFYPNSMKKRFEKSIRKSRD